MKIWNRMVTSYNYACTLKISHHGCAGTHGKYVRIIDCHDTFILSSISKRITKATVGILTNGK